MIIQRGLTILIITLFLANFTAAIVHDVDNDGIGSDTDNCPLDYNPLQEDADHDGTGDLCDASPEIIIIGPVIIIDDEDSICETGHCRCATKINWTEFCEPNWQCSGWSECNEDGFMTRKCTDADFCVESYNKPAETTGCEPQKVLTSSQRSNNYFFISLVVTFFLLIALGVLLIVK